MTDSHVGASSTGSGSENETTELADRNPSANRISIANLTHRTNVEVGPQAQADPQTKADQQTRAGPYFPPDTAPYNPPDRQCLTGPYPTYAHGPTHPQPHAGQRRTSYRPPSAQLSPVEAPGHAANGGPPYPVANPNSPGLEAAKDERLRLQEEQLQQLVVSSAALAQELEEQRRLKQDSEQLLEGEKARHGKTRRKSIIVIAALSLAFVVITLPVGVLYGKQKHTPTPTQPPTKTLTVSALAYTNVLPVTDSNLGAENDILNNMFAPPSPDGPETRVVYNAGSNGICIRVKSGSGWHNNVQCVGGTDILPNSPITILDWFGGPSIYYFTAKHILSGIDHIPQNDTWRHSSVNQYSIPVHNQSQIASMTWLNGTSVWLYYQDPIEQIREFGLDDYRDFNWREGSAGPLGTGQAGTGIGVARWLNGTDEVEEIFFQKDNAAISGRMYAKNAWRPDFYAIDGTPENVPDATSIAATAVVESDGNSTVLLAYFAKDGFLNVQTRATRDVPDSNLGAFSAPVEVVEGDGHPDGITAVGSLGVPRILFSSAQKIFDVTRGSASAGNWTTTVI